MELSDIELDIGALLDMLLDIGALLVVDAAAELVATAELVLVPAVLSLPQAESSATPAAASPTRR